MRDLIKAFDMINDDFGQFFGPTMSTTYRSRLYDPDKFDLVPKQAWFDEELNKITRERERLDQSKKNYDEYYEKEIKRLEGRKEELQKQR